MKITLTTHDDYWPSYTRHIKIESPTFNTDGPLDELPPFNVVADIFGIPEHVLQTMLRLLNGYAVWEIREDGLPYEITA